jgi:hypothetical protein
LLLIDVPAKMVTEGLGHSSITRMLDPYRHVLPTRQKRAADTLGGLLAGVEKRAQRSDHADWW